MLKFLVLIALSYAVAEEEISVTLEMKEENPVDMKIGSLRENLPSHLGPNFSFLLMDNFFQVDAQTGDVTANQTIDRETLCPKYKQCCGVVECIMKADVFVLDGIGELSMSISLKINILDVNDNQPVFNPAVQQISVSESADVGTEITLRSATDADINPANQINRYQLDEGTGTFKLEGTAHNTARLRLMQPLDRERVSHYSALLRACDDKSCSTCQLNIEIEDVNDNSPQFERKLYSRLLKEDMQIRALIFNLNATDADSGERARVLYNFKEPVDEDLKNTFELDTNTGQLTLRRRLDASIRDEYKFEVVACDSVDPSCVGGVNSTTEVILTIQDVNNHSPTIEIVTPRNMNMSAGENSQNMLSIYENMQPGNIAIVKVHDRDVGSNARTYCKLESPSHGNTPTFILIHGTSALYHLRTARVFDYEQESIVTTTIKCHDSGTPALTSTRAVTLRILDVNEFPPEFSRRVFHSRVPENSELGVEVITLAAVDKDGQAELRYNLAPAPLHYSSNSHLVGSSVKAPYEDRENIDVNRFFTLDPKSGVLRTSREELDREKLDQITLIVLVTDSLKAPVFTATATISIEVLDVNDNTPVFVNPPANVDSMSTFQNAHQENAFTVRENAPRYTRLSGRLEARDSDAGPNGQVFFSLKSTWALKSDSFPPVTGNAFNEYYLKNGRQPVEQRIFQITPDGGIETLVELDRETVAYYLLTVAVRDNGTNSLASTAMLLVQVLDENDNRPIWAFSNDADRQINITTANHPGTLVVRLQARDIDADAAGTVEFQILGPHGQPLPPVSLTRGLFQQPDPSGSPSTTPAPFIEQPAGELKGYRMGPFYLNGSTGELLVADRLVPGSSKIRLRAIDMGTQRLYTDIYMTVNVKQDHNEYGGFFGNGRTGALNVTIILVMIAVTAIISLLLIIAIVCVRRKPARYDGVIQNGQDYTGIVPATYGGTYMDPSKEALTPNTWSATVGSKDCSSIFYPGSGLIDENGFIVSPGPHSYGSPVIGGSGLGISDNTSIICPAPQQTDINCDLSGVVPMHTFGTITRSQRPGMGSLHGLVSGVRMAGSLQYEVPIDADSGDSGRGPSEDGNQLMMLDNQRSGTLFSPHAGGYQYGTYTSYRPSSRAEYGRSASAMSGTYNCTTPRSYLQNCPQPIGGGVGTCPRYGHSEYQSPTAYNEAIYQQQQQQQMEVNPNLYSSRMLQNPAGMPLRGQLSTSPRRGIVETGSLPRNRLVHSSVTFQSPPIGSGYSDDISAAPIKLDLRGVGPENGLRNSGEEEEFASVDSKQQRTFVDGRPPSVPRPPGSTTLLKMSGLEIDG